MDVIADPCDWFRPDVRENFTAANAARQRESAERMGRRCRAALRVGGIPQHLRQVLRLRVDLPDLSLTELGERVGLTKDQVAGRIRRGLLLAERKTRR